MAIDQKAVDIAREVPFGEGSPELRGHPPLSGVELPERLGTHGNAGPMLTGEDIVFVGGGEPYLYAFDKITGAEFWLSATPYRMFADQMTYRLRQGRKSVVVAAGSGPDAASVAFARPN